MSTQELQFQRVLIANRGEIAVRIARTLREMGISPIAIYSDADRNAPHVQACDMAYRIGPAPASESYLQIGKILQVAKQAGADAIHPGYGFLSEKASFVEQVEAENIRFIGPAASAMRTMGSKTSARAAMQRAGVPCVPGSDGALHDDTHALQVAEQMGYPVMLKASAGGGGKGMRLVHKAENLAEALRAARSEAQNAFGDPTVYMEKAILNPRHVEIQVFCDSQGRAYGVGERECSMQRRHQKVIEEAPCVILDEALRAEMTRVACKAAEAVDYRGAGTIEFLLDENRQFYFLEMNTRLQVEHPVTELCYGVDLVRAQILTAGNKPLDWQQHPPKLRGHAIEARLYAEDPAQNFLPSPGPITHVRFAQGPGIRIDSGVESGFEVSRYYDPMIAKVSVWAENRPRAIARLIRALKETHVQGIVTNKAFLIDLLRNPDFNSGAYHTGTLGAWLDKPKVPQTSDATRAACIAALVQTYLRDSRTTRAVERQNRDAAGWRAVNWRMRGA